MKTLFVILLSTLTWTAMPGLAIAQTTDSALAKKFISLNDSGKFTEAQSMFAASLQNQVSPEILQSSWQKIEEQYGQYQSITSIKELQQDSLHVIIVVSDFKKANISFALAFGPSHVMYGFRAINVKTKNDSPPLANTISKDITIPVHGGSIAATLLVPDTTSPVPVTLIIAGSGPTDRDGNSGSFLQAGSYRMLADSLAVHGIASLRYDKRYVGQSMNFTTPVDELRFNDYADDAVALINFLKTDKRFSKIIIIGHSEGSLLGMIAAEKIPVNAYISLAGMGEPMDKVIEWQIAQQPGVTPSLEGNVKMILDSMREGKVVHEVPSDLKTLLSPAIQPYLISEMKYDPAKEMKKIKIPVLIVNGTTDLQVTVQQAKLLHQAKPDAQLAIIPGMNHVLKNAPEDRNENFATYSNPDLPLNALLVQKITEFIQSLPSHNHS